MATAFELGRDHPNSPSFTPREDDGAWYPTEAELEAAAKRIVAETDAEALARIDIAMLPLRPITTPVARVGRADVWPPEELEKIRRIYAEDEGEES